jgi:thiosulfate reductase cytochrome b subunit
MITGLQIGIFDPVTGPSEKYQGWVTLHNVSGIILTVSYLGFFFGNLFTGNGKHYRLRIRGSVTRLWKQLRHYSYGMFKGEENPFPVDSQRKFNPLQKLTYAGAMYLTVPLLIITGWIMMYPSFLIDLFPEFNVWQFNHIMHIVMAVVISLFLLLHLAVSIGGRNLRSIISGWKESR